MLSPINIEDPKYKNVNTDVKSVIKSVKTWTEATAPLMEEFLDSMRREALCSREEIFELKHQLEKSKEDYRRVSEFLSKTLTTTKVQPEVLSKQLSDAKAVIKELQDKGLTGGDGDSNLQLVAALRAELEEKIEEIRSLRETPEEKKNRLIKEKIYATREKILLAQSNDEQIQSLLDEE